MPPNLENPGPFVSLDLQAQAHTDQATVLAVFVLRWYWSVHGNYFASRFPRSVALYAYRRYRQQGRRGVTMRANFTPQADEERTPIH